MRIIRAIVPAGIVVGLGALAARTVATRVVPVARCGREHCRSARFVRNLRRRATRAVTAWRGRIPDTGLQRRTGKPAGEES